MLFVFEAAILHGYRRRVAACRGAILLLLTLAGRAEPAMPELVDLRPSAPAGSYRVCKVVVDVEGNLKLNAEGKEISHLPLKAKAELEYAERVLGQAKQWSEV